MKKNLFLLVFFILLIAPIFTFAADQVEINTASLQQLEEIIGIGPVKAQEIINSRPFSSVDDLLRVKGIGEKTLQKIKEQGLAYVSGQIQQPTQEINSPTPAISPNPTPSTQNPTPDITYPDGVIINEILPSPKGADETNEWIELYNKNNFDVDLQGWKIQDTEGTMTTYIFPENTKIPVNGYFVLKRTETKIILNNDRDSLNLIQPDEKIIDSVSYTNAKTNQSYNKTLSGWNWGKTLTPESVNITEQILPKSNKIANNIAVASLENSINPVNLGSFDELNQENLKNSNPWFLFLTALAITIISAIIILLLKFRILKNLKS